jgi:hypothetical protein
MLSNPLHRFSAYNTLPSSNMLSNGHVSSNHMHTSGLETLAHGSQYALQHLQQHVDIHQNSQAHRNHNSKHRQHPYGNGAGNNGRSVNGTATSGPIRRRISRACDQCNQLRTKCDGQNPCAHCVGKFLFYAELVGNVTLIKGRIRFGLRVHTGAKEARKGIAKRPRPTGCRCCCQWTKISYWSIVRGEVSN